MKRINKDVKEKKSTVKEGKVSITLSKPYLLEGKVIVAGTRILVEAEDIYDEFTPPPAASDPGPLDNIYTMKKICRMDGDEDYLDEEDDEDEITVSAMRRMRKLRRMGDDMIDSDDIMEDEDEDDYIMDEEEEELANELEAMKRMYRMKMRRMNRMKRMKKSDKKEEQEDDEEDKDDKDDKDEK